MSKERKRFVVYRPRWLRGRGLDSALTKGGAKCCLGFVCQQLGAKSLGAAPMPSFLYEEQLSSGIPNWLRQIENRAARINDREDTSDKEREEELREIFKSVGKQIVFTGPKPKNWAKDR